MTKAQKDGGGRPLVYNYICMYLIFLFIFSFFGLLHFRKI